ncbi:hypothetical protein IMZ48_33605 [Candidatus Bathyarchaeota archaeon]|nr:hypothetical protein [Candidatus Bathyarchaeota archaeon]
MERPLALERYRVYEATRRQAPNARAHPPPGQLPSPPSPLATPTARAISPELGENPQQPSEPDFELVSPVSSYHPSLIAWINANAPQTAPTLTTTLVVDIRESRGVVLAFSDESC